MGNKLAKWAKVALAAALTASVFGSGGARAEGDASKPFRDIQSGYWAADGINKGVAKGYVEGYTDETFKPEANVTRAEFVKMVVSALNLQVRTESGKWYEPYVTAASEKGLYKTEDFANTESSWNKTLTREEMARIANRAIGQKENEQEHPWMYMPKHKYMYTATKNGLLTGVGKGEIAPDGATTRAQAVVVIERILAVNAGEKLPVDKYALSSAEIYWHGTNIFTVMPEVFYARKEWLGANGRNESADFWYEDRMTVTSRDGLYQGKLDALIAIDLADPNDPNLKLLPPIKELVWGNHRFGEDTKDFMVKDQMNSYILYFKTHTVYNKNPKVYSATSAPQLSVSGFDNLNRSESDENRELNELEWIYHKKESDLDAYIIPKSKLRSRDSIIIDLTTPAFSNYGYISSRILQLSF